MRLKFNGLATAALLVTSMALSGCGQEDKPSNVIKVGVITGAEEQVAEVAKKVAKEKYGLDVELVSFNAFLLPNEPLDKGELDANAFQHRPFLEQQIKERGYKLAVVGNTFVYPIAGYSKKIKSLSELKDGSLIAIPNDPTNLGRSLLLLQQAGLIKLKSDTGLLPTSLDIIENPKNLQILELEAPQLPHSLDDPKVVVAVISTTYLNQTGLTPTKDGIFIENKDSPYVNIIVSREDNKNDEKVKNFVKAYQSEEVNQAAEKIFNGGSVKGW